MNNDEKKVSELRIHHVFDKIHVLLQQLRLEVESQKDPVTLEFVGQIDVAILKPISGIRKYMMTGEFYDYEPMKSPWR